jgi:hypothetical protein
MSLDAIFFEIGGRETSIGESLQCGHLPQGAIRDNEEAPDNAGALMRLGYQEKISISQPLARNPRRGTGS